MLAFIQAGGLGTRLKAITGSLPKPLVPVDGRPALFRSIDWLKSYPMVKRVIVLAGYQGDLVKARLQEEFGDFVLTLIEEKPLGSGGCLRLALPFVKNQACLLVGGDLLINQNLDKFLAKHRSCQTNCTILVHGNNHPKDADLVVPSSDWQFVDKFLTRPHPEGLATYNLVNAGLMLMEPAFWLSFPEGQNLNFEKDVLIPYLKDHRVGLHVTGDYIQDLGTPERLRIAEEWLRQSPPPRAILLDSGDLGALLDSKTQIEKLRHTCESGVLLGIANCHSQKQTKLQTLEMALGDLGIRVSWREVRENCSKQDSVLRMARDLTLERANFLDEATFVLHN